MSTDNLLKHVVDVDFNAFRDVAKADLKARLAPAVLTVRDEVSANTVNELNGGGEGE